MLDAIRETEDRSHTARLLARLAQAPEGEELGEIAWTLERLADPRSLAPLTSLLEDPRAPERAREAAAGALRSMGWTTPRAARRAYWGSGDPVLERHALLSMDRADAEIVEAVALDPGHRYHLEAIESLAFDFNEPRFQELKIRALAHPDPRVRQAACDTLLWDEPVAAEGPLLAAAGDRDQRVAEAAVNTLRYYASRRVLASLAELKGSPVGELRARADESFSELQGTFWGALERASGDGRARLEAWMAPVWSLVAFEPEPGVGDQPEHLHQEISPRPSPPPLPTAAELEAMLADLDGPWAAKKDLLRRLDWQAYGPGDRQRLRSTLLGHEDPEVRDQACRALSAWGDHDALIALIDDPVFLVAKTATYSLGQTRPASSRAAARCWQRLHEPATTSTHAYETLAAYVAHAPRDEAVPRLARLARHDLRESVRNEALHKLASLEARDEIASLLDLLAQPPLVTWAGHIALLSAARDLELDVEVPGFLMEADDVWLQAELLRAP